MDFSNIVQILILLIGVISIIVIFSTIYKEPVSINDCKDINSKLLYKIYKLLIIGAISLSILIAVTSKILLISV